jgi:autotransporter-associated beta strand protein
MKSHYICFVISSTSVASSLALLLGIEARAADYTWGGGNLDWTDTSASGWNGGPPAGGDNATINSGIVTLTTNNLANPLNSITIGGSGKLTQTTANTWSAFNSLTLSGGTLESARPSGDAFGAYQVSNTVNVTGSSASAISTSGTGSIFINLGLAVSNDPTFTTFNVSDVTSDASADLAVSTVLANNIATNFSSFSTAGLIKSGAGRMTLSANNTYTGGTTVNNGVLEVAGSGGGNSNIRGTVTVNNGAELRYTGGDGTGFGFNGGNKIDTININGGLVDSQNVTHLWSATLNMTGGELRVNGGVSNPVGQSIHWNNSSANILASSGTASITGRINLRGDGGYSNAVFDVANGSAATDLLVSAAVTEEYGSVGITKNGAGTMELSGGNSYTGATNVTAGTLVVNGNISTSSLTTVDGGATLQGTGTVGTTTVNGILAPGNSIGTIGIVGTLDLNGISNFEIDPTLGLGLNRAADLANVTGAISYGGILNVLYGGNAANFTNGMIFNLFDATLGFSDAFTTVNLPSLAGGLTWQNDLATSGSISVVPEPHAALLGGLGLLALLRRRERR